MDVEANPPFRDTFLGERVILALPKSIDGALVYADAMHAPPGAPRGTGGSSMWSWRAWLGPTVRRWQFENFRIRLQSNELRKISNFPVAINE